MANNDLFISYSRDDKAWVYEFWRNLRDQSRRNPWIDQDLKVASIWWDSILTAIEDCDVFVYIMTPRSLESIYCKAEVDYAIALNKPILPVMLKPCNPPKNISRFQFLDLIRDMPMANILLIVERGLGEVYLRIERGEYPPRDAPRPALPTADQQPTRNAQKPTQPVYAGSGAATVTATNPRQLSAWNPMDWFLLLWWLFINPAAYVDYTHKHGKPVRVASWLASTLMWGVFAIPALATIWQPDLGPAITSLGLIGWLFTGLFSHQENVVAGVAWLVAVGVVWVVAVGVAIGVAVGVLEGVVGGLEFVLAWLVAGGVAGEMAGGVVGGIAGGIEAGIKEHRRNARAVLAFIALLASYAWLIFYYGGGWRLFAGA